MATQDVSSTPQKQPFLFADLGPRQVVAEFTGGPISSGAEVLLLRQLDASLELNRRHPEDRGCPLASDSTLHRFELGHHKKSRAHKIEAKPEEIADLLVRMGVGTLDKKSHEVVIDLDATDVPLHGKQESRFFHG